MKKDLIISLLLLTGSIALYGSLTLIDEPAAATFPRVVIIIMGLLGLLLFIQTIAGKQRTERTLLQADHVAHQDKASKDSCTFNKFPFVTVLGCFSLIAAYLLLIERIGFYLSALLFFIGTTFILGRKDLTLQKCAKRFGIAFIFIAVLFILFNKLLVVQTPKGLLF